MTNEKALHEPLFHLVKRDIKEWWKPLLIRALTVLFGLVFIAILSSITLKVSPLFFFKYLFNGTFGSTRKILKMCRALSLLLLIALALTPAFKMKFWNIGAEGQVLISAFACIACMINLGGKMPDALIIIISFISAIAAGAIWAVIPAIFKAFLNTNETLFTLMLNYVATQFILYFIKIWVPNGTGNLDPIPYGNLPQLFGNDYYITIIVALVVTAFIYLYLKYSKHGYEISVVGESRNTAKYIGVNVKKVVIRTLILSGAICGLTGFLIAAGIDHTVSSSSAGGYGFTAILVSWLAQFNPFVMILTAFLTIFLTQGTAQVMTYCGVSNSFFSQVVIGVMFLLIIACEFFINYKVRFRATTNNTSAKKENK